MPIRSSSSLWVGWTSLSGVEALQGSFSDPLLLDSPWREFNVRYKIYLFEDTWCYIVLCFDLPERYSNILKSQHKYNIAVAIYTWIIMQPWFTLLVSVRMLGILSSPGREMWAKASSSSFWWLFSFYTLCWVEPQMHLSPHWSGYLGKTLHCNNCLGKVVYTAWSLTGAAVSLKQRFPSSPPCVVAFSTLFGASPLYFFPEFIGLAQLERCRPEYIYTLVMWGKYVQLH